MLQVTPDDVLLPAVPAKPFIGMTFYVLLFSLGLKHNVKDSIESSTVSHFCKHFGTVF